MSNYRERYDVYDGPVEPEESSWEVFSRLNSRAKGRLIFIMVGMLVQAIYFGVGAPFLMRSPSMLPWLYWVLSVVAIICFVWFVMRFTVLPLVIATLLPLIGLLAEPGRSFMNLYPCVDAPCWFQVWQEYYLEVFVQATVVGMIGVGIVAKGLDVARANDPLLEEIAAADEPLY